MPADTENSHVYPHQLHDEVTPAMLHRDMTDNPHAYHEALKPHANRHLKEQLGDTALQPGLTESLSEKTSRLMRINEAIDKKTAILTSEDAFFLIEEKKATWVVANLMLFNDQDRSYVASMILDTDKWHRFSDYLSDYSDGSLDKTIAWQIVNKINNFVPVIWLNLDVFKDLSDDEFALGLIKEGLGHLVYEGNFDADNFSVEVAKALIEHECGDEVAMNIPSFKPDDRLEVAHLLMSEPKYLFKVSSDLQYLPKIDRELTLRLIEAGYAVTVLEKIEMVERRDWEFVNKILDGNDHLAVNMLAQCLDDLEVAPAEFIHKLYEGREFDALQAINEGVLKGVVSSNPELYADAGELLPELFDRKILRSGLSLEAYREVIDAAGVKVPDVIRYNDELFGKYGNYRSLLVINGILQGVPSDEAQQLGVSTGGEEGVQQLREALGELTNELRTLEITSQTEMILERSPLARAMLMRLTEYDAEGGYGEHSDESLRRKLEYLREARSDGLIEDLKEDYVPSSTYEIATSNSKKEKPEWTEDVISRYDALLKDIHAALTFVHPDWRMSGETMPFNELLTNIRVGVGSVLLSLDEQLEAVDDSDPKADIKRQSIQKKINSLHVYVQEAESGEGQKRFVMNSPAAFARAFEELEKYPELHSPMRRLIFAMALRKHPGQMSTVHNLTESKFGLDGIGVEEMAAMREFIDHIVNQETYKDYFPTSKLANKFKKMTGAGRFEEALQRANKNATHDQTTGIRFAPSRGILMEMSGQIGNACWADKDESIAENMPNMTAIIMQARPGQENERVIGSALLIETSDVNTGEKVLLLRGTNPRENYINKVDPEEFYNAITDYVRKTAVKREMKPAIVIDDHSGGSGTNRPVLFGYMWAQQKSMKPIVVENYDTYFNGYNVTNNSYAL